MISSKASKMKAEEKQEPVAPTPINEVRSAPAAPAKTSTSAPTAVIGPKIRFKGELFGEEDLLVEGTIEGTIELKNHNLTVGPQGSIRANATAKSIIVEGKVEGDLYGSERILIKESSDVSGNVTAARVALEDGAKFKGSIDMSGNFSAPDSK